MDSFFEQDETFEAQDNRMWPIGIVGHRTYQSALENRSQLGFRPSRSDRRSNIHDPYVYQVEWKLFDGNFVTSWEVETLLLGSRLLSEYKEMYNLDDSRYLQVIPYDTADESVTCTATTA